MAFHAISHSSELFNILAIRGDPTETHHFVVFELAAFIKEGG